VLSGLAYVAGAGQRQSACTMSDVIAERTEEREEGGGEGKRGGAEGRPSSGCRQHVFVSDSSPASSRDVRTKR